MPYVTGAAVAAQNSGARGGAAARRVQGPREGKVEQRPSKEDSKETAWREVREHGDHSTDCSAEPCSCPFSGSFCGGSRGRGQHSASRRWAVGTCTGLSAAAHTVYMQVCLSFTAPHAPPPRLCCPGGHRAADVAVAGAAGLLGAGAAPRAAFAAASPSAPG